MITKPIQPVKIFPNLTATNFSFTSAGVSPDYAAQIFWQLSDASGKAIQNGSLEMPPEIYNEWTGSDEFPLTWAAGVLGLTLL